MSRHLSFSRFSNMRSLRFQVMSDLHLEVGDQYRSFQIPVRAPCLILAGDIGRLQDYEKYLSFVSVQCANFDMVCLILGNHEFYGLSRAEGLARAKALENDHRTQGRLTVLTRRRLDIGPSFCILGCTLQSHIRPENRNAVVQRVKDFQKITGWTVDQHNNEHENDLDWLRKEIDSVHAERSILVITHHAPSKKGSSHPDHEGNAWADAFATDLIQVHKELTKVQWWVFGHTHYNNQWREDGVNLISNQRGYILNPDRCRQPRSVLRWKDTWCGLGSLFKREAQSFDPGKCIRLRV